MLGIGGRGGLRPDAAALARPRPASAGAHRRRRRPQRHRRRHRRRRRGRLPGHAHRHLRRGQARPGRGGGPRATPARCTSSTSASARTCRRPTAFRLTDADVAARLAPPSAGDDKYSQGVVGVVAGSATYPGAGVLCTGAALRTRPGLVRYAGTAADGVRAAWPEAIVTDGRPGGRRPRAGLGGRPRHGHRRRRPQRARRGAGHRPAGGRRRRRAHDAGRASRTLVRDRTAPTVLTPHDREFARFGGRASGADRIGAARRLAADLGCAVLLKGDATVVADADGTAFVNAHRHARGWPPPAPATCCPGIAGAAAGHRPGRGARPAPSPPTCTAGPASSRPSAGRCSPATWSAGCPRRSAGCAGFRRAAWETRGRDAPAATRPAPRSSSTSTPSPPTPRCCASGSAAR